MPTIEDMLVSLGRKYLGEDGSNFVKSFLEDKGVHNTKILLLGVIDRAWQDELVTFEVAKEDYNLLELDSETARRVRQARASRLALQISVE